MARYKEQLDSKVQESSLQLPGPCDLAPDFASDCAKLTAALFLARLGYSDTPPRARVRTRKRTHTHFHAIVQRKIRQDAETCILSFFNSIFIHRYKDSHFEVRAKCTEAVGKLIMEYSSKFLDNTYLVYVGWALYDKSSKVRIAALDAVDKFYNSSLVNNIEAFTLRFR